MSLPKNLAGIGIFLVTLCAATLLTGVLAVRTPRPASITNTNVTAILATEIAHQVQLVTLDRENQRSHTKLTLMRDSRSPAPERVWVWTYFFTPNDMRTWASEPTEVREPFRDGDRVSVTVNSVCRWCDDTGAPASGYYAGVHVSTKSEEAAVLRADQLSLDIVRAAPVVVQAEQR
ncbi:MAG: hypothetical protein M3371_08145 [Acidobacteriota bacterium]|nr:hypothetical protein [Acidobacteriota bacterium]